MSPLEPSTVHVAAPPPLSVLFQGQGEPPLLPSTIHTYVPLVYAFLLRQGVPLHNHSVEPAPLTEISD